MKIDRSIEEHYAEAIGLSDFSLTSQQEDLDGVDMILHLDDNVELAIGFRVLDWNYHGAKYDGWLDENEASVSLTLWRASGAKTEADKLSSDELVTVFCDGSPYSKPDLVCWGAVKTDGVRKLFQDKNLMGKYLRIWNSRYHNKQTEDNQHFAHDRRGGGVRSFFILRSDVMIEAGIHPSLVIPSVYEYCDMSQNL